MRIVVVSLLLAASCSIAYGQNGNGEKIENALQINSKPQGAVIEISGKFSSITGRTPFVVPYHVLGTYYIKASKEGYEDRNTSVRLVKEGYNSITIRMSAKTRAKAAIRSMVFPGWGQAYGQSRTKGLIVGVIQLAFGVYAGYSAIEFASEKDQYDKANLAYQQASTFEQAQAAKTVLDKQFAEASDARDTRDTALLVAGGFWVYSFFDSMIFFSNGGKSVMNLFNPPAPSGSGELQFRINFKVRL